MRVRIMRNGFAWVGVDYPERSDTSQRFSHYLSNRIISLKSSLCLRNHYQQQKRGLKQMTKSISPSPSPLTSSSSSPGVIVSSFSSPPSLINEVVSHHCVIPPLPASQSTFLTFQAYLRSHPSKYNSKYLRERRNHIPALIFNQSNSKVNLSIERDQLLAAIRTWSEPCLMTRTIQIDIQKQREEEEEDEEEEEKMKGEKREEVTNKNPQHPEIQFVLIKQIDRHPEYLNEEDSVGVRKGGGLLHLRHNIPLFYRGPLTNLPSRIVIDLAQADMGAVIRSSDIKLPPFCKVKKPNKKWVLAIIQGLKKQSAAEEEEEEDTKLTTEATTAGKAAPTPSTSATTGGGGAAKKEAAAAGGKKGEAAEEKKAEPKKK